MQDLATESTLTSITITWTPPMHTNGIILSYEVSYSLNTNRITVNTTNLAMALVVSSLAPFSTLYNVSVTAYTSAGSGEAAVLDSVSTHSRESIMGESQLHNVQLLVQGVHTVAGSLGSRASHL